MTEQKTPYDIAEIWEALQYRHTSSLYEAEFHENVDEWFRFLLSELERKDEEKEFWRKAAETQKENNIAILEENRKLKITAEKRFQELCEKDREIQKLREELGEAKENYAAMESMWHRSQQEREKLIEEIRKGINECDELHEIAWDRWEKETDLYEQGRAAALDSAAQMLHGILEEIGVTN